MGADGHYQHILGEYPQHWTGDRLKAQRAHRHQCKTKQHGGGQRLAAAVNVVCSVVEADDGHDAGLHGSQRDEEEGLPFVIQAKRRDRLIGKACKNQVQTKDVEGIRRLHQHVRHAQTEDGLDVSGVLLESRRFAQSLSHHHQCSNDLSGDGRNGCTRKAHLRQAEHAEDQQRIEDDIGHRADDLRKHGCFHITGGLQHLCPDAFKEQAEAEHAHDASIGDYILNDRFRAGGHPRISGHDQSADQCKHEPHGDGQWRTHTSVFVRFILLPGAETSSHHGVDAYACADSQRDHQ